MFFFGHPVYTGLEQRMDSIKYLWNEEDDNFGTLHASTITHSASYVIFFVSTILPISYYSGSSFQWKEQMCFQCDESFPRDTSLTRLFLLANTVAFFVDFDSLCVVSKLLWKVVFNHTVRITSVVFVLGIRLLFFICVLFEISGDVSEWNSNPH